MDKKTGCYNRFVYLVHWEFREEISVFRWEPLLLRHSLKGGQNCELVGQNLTVQYYSPCLSLTLCCF